MINNLQEAENCMLCKKARCQKNCPINTPIPQVIQLYKNGEIEKAGEILFNNNPLSVICAIVCPHEKQCRGNCIRGIKKEPVHFHSIEQEISTEYLKNTKFIKPESNGIKVAVIGSGPAGLTVAFELAKKGYDVTIFEKNEKIDVLFFDREDIIGDTKDIIPGFNETREGLHNIEELDEVVRPGLGAKIFRKSILTEDMFYESTIFEDLYTTYIYLDKCNNYFYSSKCYYTIYHDVDSSSLSSKPTAESFARSLNMILMVHAKLERSSLRYSLELWMALLFTTYWKARVKNDTSYNSKVINENIQKIAGILKKNKVVIKPSGKKHIKILIYRILLLISKKKYE